jgi:hypothetical protein
MQEIAIESLFKNEKCLKIYALDPRADIPLLVKSFILTESFWQKLKALHKLIDPVAEF